MEEKRSCIAHVCFHVQDLEKSKAFYARHFGFLEEKRKEDENGAYILSFLGDGSGFLIELAWVKHPEAGFSLGDNRSHLAVRVENPEEKRELFEREGAIVMEKDEIGKCMGDGPVYFVRDPDGHKIEILKLKS